MILEKISQVYPQLTKSQRRLADFIANSYREAAFMTASRLAKRLDLNEATVIRFAQRLGYPGYPELIRDVQAIVQEELKTSDAEAPAEAEEPFLISLNNEVEALQRGVSHVSRELAHQVAVLMREARRIWVVGQGASFHLAGLLAAGLAGLGLDARLGAGDPVSLAQTVAALQEGDALVGISAHEESFEIAQALGAARERGARTLALAPSPISKMAQAAELTLVCPASELFLVPSAAAMGVFIDALIQALAGADAARSRRCLAEAGRALRAIRGEQGRPGA